MPDKYDPYREALVVETETVWPEEIAPIAPEDRQRVARSLHAAPSEATQLEYVRVHTGFCRRIVVAEEDLQRQDPQRGPAHPEQASSEEA